ncbi:hypothetical protein L7F22_065240 [Adiantum nelumboides]|nr:hypothetical protein [Adiantum nelumboides]MCO5610992.1 hypothetical protein [Adiantum nelumboides]
MARLFLLIISALVLLVAAARRAHASDEDPLQDFCVALSAAERQQIFGFPDPLAFNGVPCKAAANVQSSDFVSQQLRAPANFSGKLGSAVNLANAATFLNTQGLSMARIDYMPGGINPPHVHPRTTEVIYLAQGSLLVGFVSTAPANKLFYQTIHAGDLFVFPRGLVHFQLNPGKSKPALAIAALNGQNPGASQLAVALFASNPVLPEAVLEATLGINDSSVEHLVANVRATLMA